MFNFTKVSPSIIAIDYNNKELLQKSLKELEDAGATMLHLDVMDGEFVENKTFDYKFVEEVKDLTDLILDVHLMVKEPYHQIQNYVDAGADIITVHYEACKDIERTLNLIKKNNCLAGVAINPSTEVDELKDILNKNLVDLVLVMSVEPGKCGQKYINGSAEKVMMLKELDKNIDVQIDGGITEENAVLVRKSGADIIVSGSTIFNSNNISKTIKQLQGR